MATAWRLYTGRVLGGPPLIAYGTGQGEPGAVDAGPWNEIRVNVEEAQRREAKSWSKADASNRRLTEP